MASSTRLNLSRRLGNFLSGMETLQGLRRDERQMRLGNFLSGMETIDGNYRPLHLLPWKLP